MSDFIEVQQRFMDHIRQPDAHSAPEGIEDRRMKVYRELFFNNVSGFLSNGFPVLESLYSEQEWPRLCRCFFAEHDCRSPYFVDISKEFVEYLSNEYQPTDADPPFMAELAHYEWVELAVSIHKDIVPEQGENGGKYGLNPTASVLSYTYPVHQISADFQPQTAPEQPTFLVVYRDRDDAVQFVEINMMSAHLLSHIQASDAVELSEMVDFMSAAIPSLEPEQMRQGVEHIVTQMAAQTVLIAQN